ncbi:MAG: CDP-alcohol phosphatidyltransferase family protein [Anaerolineae bacterium]|nr:CDP-alcohol phosphatidyltransferase family protein [Anaerolineae bacterium]
MVSQSQLPTTPNLSTRLRHAADQLMAGLGRSLHRLGVHPDVLTLLGLALTAIAALLATQGAFLAAGIMLLVSLPLDALDGAVARAMGRTNPFGGVLDSTADRYADLFLLLGLAYYLAVQDAFGEMVLAFAATVGSVLVSYIRARAGTAGLPCAGGWFSRMERLAVLILTLFTGWLLPGLLILAVGSNLTALHRLWSVYRFAQQANQGEM